jgi:hypothetical protein
MKHTALKQSFTLFATVTIAADASRVGVAAAGETTWTWSAGRGNFPKDIC